MALSFPEIFQNVGKGAPQNNSSQGRHHPGQLYKRFERRACFSLQNDSRRMLSTNRTDKAIFIPKSLLKASQIAFLRVLKISTVLTVLAPDLFAKPELS